MKRGKIFTLLILFLLMLAPIAFAQDQDEIVEPELNDEETFETQEPEEYFAEEEIPEGCQRTTTGTGVYTMECDFDASEFQDFKIADEMNDCVGRFEMMDGKPTCIMQGEAGFAGSECPSQENLDSMTIGCEGTIEHFVDEGGCSAIMCMNENFKDEFENKIRERYREDPLKEQAIMCAKDGGKFISIKDEPRCMLRPSETMQMKKELGTMTDNDIENAGKRLDSLDNNIDKITDKLNNLEGEIFDEAGAKLGEVKDKISEIKSDLITSDLDEDERRKLLMQMQGIKKSISDITTGIIEGKMPDADYMAGEMFEQYEEFYGGPFGSKEELKAWAEKEKSVLEKVRNCDRYSSTESFVPPNPEGKVVKVEISFSNNICKMIMYMADGATAEYSVPGRIYTTFRGPEDLMKQDISCSGTACQRMREMMTMSHGPGVDPEAEACMEACIVEDCDDGMFTCMKENLEKCEDECGMRKGPDMEDMGDEERCIMECVSPGVMCMPGPGGEMNPECEACAQQCAGLYEGPCLTDESWREKEVACMSQGDYMEAKPVMGDSGQGYECTIDIECIDRSSEVGDEPGITAGAVQENESEGFFTRIANWFKNLFSGKKSSKVDEGADTPADVAEDLSQLSEDLESVESDIE